MMQETVEGGVELSEALVLTRTRAADLESVKKLNCWASNINDVEVVRRMPNLEVCSLSINCLTSLRDFAHCHKLKELYVRTNNIQQLGDIHYLKSLPRLRSLWLSENPCANTPNYRPTVLKSLPNLQKLDNKAVTPEEVEAAQVEGDEIPIPDDFSNSSLFTSSLNDTQSSVSSVMSPRESLSGPRKKREQRRQRLAAEEAARASKEDGSCSSSRSEEEHSSCDKSDDVTKYDSDMGWPQTQEDVSESQDTCISESLSSTSDHRQRLKDDGGTLSTINKEESIGEFHLSNGGLTKGSDNDNFEQNENEDASQTTDQTLNQDKQLQENNNNNVNKTDFLKELAEIDITEGLEEIQSQSPENNTENIPDNPLLDKIRLNDSLACVDSQDIVESIALDDLIIEIASESKKESVKEGTSMDSVDAVVDSVSMGSQLEEIESLNAQSQSIQNESQSIQNESQSIQNESQSIQNESDTKIIYTVSKEEEEKTDEKRKGAVDWEEYNRLRAELGVKQVERTSTKSFHNDVNRIRNSNILQAVLSLIKELDKDSLDIVSSAVQSRLDKL